MITPVERVGDIWLKRDDLWCGEAPAQGGKSRTADAVCRKAVDMKYVEINSCHDRNSSVPGMLARVCKHYGLRLRLWIPASREPLTPVFEDAIEHGAVLEEIRPGYMSVRQKRMIDHVNSVMKSIALGVGLNWMGCGHYETVMQVSNVHDLILSGDVKRVVMPIGSGLMFEAVRRTIPYTPMLGVACGTLIGTSFSYKHTCFVDMSCGGGVTKSEVIRPQVKKDFHQEVTASVGGVDLDPVYEAKCFEFLQPGDLLWIVGHRDTQ